MARTKLLKADYIRDPSGTKQLVINILEVTQIKTGDENEDYPILRIHMKNGEIFEVSLASINKEVLFHPYFIRIIYNHSSKFKKLINENLQNIKVWNLNVWDGERGYYYDYNVWITTLTIHHKKGISSTQTLRVEDVTCPGSNGMDAGSLIDNLNRAARNTTVNNFLNHFPLSKVSIYYLFQLIII